MEIKKLLGENGPVLIKPTVFNDDRGYFFESFNEKQFKEMVANIDFVQDNESKSSYGVLRGLHFQKPPYAQAKLVRVVSGAVYDVAVDIRKGSPTYGEWVGVYLSAENHRQFYLPRGFAHGFLSLADNTVFQYKCDNFYNKESEGALRYDDKNLDIQWEEWMDWSKFKLSDKDQKNEYFNDFKSPFIYNEKPNEETEDKTLQNENEVTFDDVIDSITTFFDDDDVKEIESMLNNDLLRFINGKLQLKDNKNA